MDGLKDAPDQASAAAARLRQQASNLTETDLTESQIPTLKAALNDAANKLEAVAERGNRSASVQPATELAEQVVEGVDEAVTPVQKVRADRKLDGGNFNNEKAPRPLTGSQEQASAAGVESQAGVEPSIESTQQSVSGSVQKVRAGRILDGGDFNEEKAARPLTGSHSEKQLVAETAESQAGADPASSLGARPITDAGSIGEPLIGATIGSQIGDTEEERQENAFRGAAAGILFNLGTAQLGVQLCFSH